MSLDKESLVRPGRCRKFSDKSRIKEDVATLERLRLYHASVHFVLQQNTQDGLFIRNKDLFLTVLRVEKSKFVRPVLPGACTLCHPMA